MGWLSFGWWGLAVLYGLRQPERSRAVRWALSAGLAVSMAGQEALLVQDGLWSLQTGLPLHLCGMMGLCSLPLLWLRPRGLLCFALLLGAPCAFLALCFPAVIGCSRPFLMSLHFGRLHSLIFWAAVFSFGEKPKPLTLGEASLGQRLSLGGAAMQRMAARQLSVFERRSGGNAAGMAGAAGTGLLPVLPLAAGLSLPALDEGFLERPATVFRRPYCCRK